jgi:chromate transporter
MQTAQRITAPPLPGMWQLFRIWVGIGLQSFGGGPSTYFMIQRTFVDRYSWLSAQEFLLFNSQCFFTPGINLVALTILIGRKLGGVSGIFVSLAGLLLPSGGITCLLTLAYSLIQNNPVVQAIVRGVVPATAGLMLAVGVSTGWPILKETFAAGKTRLIVSLVLMLGCTASLLVWHISVLIALLVTSFLAMIFFTDWRSKTVPSLKVSTANKTIADKVIEESEIGSDD